MSEEEPVYSDDYVKLRDEMAEQIKTLKESFEASNKEKDELIQHLKDQNQELQRAVVRSAMTEPPKVEEHIPTEEELYAMERDRLITRTRENMKELM